MSEDPLSFNTFRVILPCLISCLARGSVNAVGGSKMDRVDMMSLRHAENPIRPRPDACVLHLVSVSSSFLSKDFCHRPSLPFLK